jgi:hypothetical protein
MSAFRLPTNSAYQGEAQAFIDGTSTPTRRPSLHRRLSNDRALRLPRLPCSAGDGYSAIRSLNMTEKSAAERVAVNTPIQVGADIVKLAAPRRPRAVRLQAGRDASPPGARRAHLRVREKDAEALMTLVKGRMERAASLRIPLRARGEGQELGKDALSGRAIGLTVHTARGRTTTAGFWKRGAMEVLDVDSSATATRGEKEHRARSAGHPSGDGPGTALSSAPRFRAPAELAGPGIHNHPRRTPGGWWIAERPERTWSSTRPSSPRDRVPPVDFIILVPPPSCAAPAATQGGLPFRVLLKRFASPENFAFNTREGAIFISWTTERLGPASPPFACS